MVEHDVSQMLQGVGRLLVLLAVNQWMWFPARFGKEGQLESISSRQAREIPEHH